MLKYMSESWMRNRVLECLSKNIFINFKNETSYFTAENPGRHLRNQVIKVITINQGTGWHCEPPDKMQWEEYNVAWWYSCPKIHILSPERRKHQTDPSQNDLQGWWGCESKESRPMVYNNINKKQFLGRWKTFGMLWKGEEQRVNG